MANTVRLLRDSHFWTAMQALPLRSSRSVRFRFNATWGAGKVKQADRKLEKIHALLEKHRCKVVKVPDTGLIVVLLGVNHIAIDSVSAVQKIAQSMEPDGICVELCDYRVQQADLLGIANTIRGNSRHFLDQDLAAKLRKSSSDGKWSAEEGLEMKMAFLEPYRILKPCYLVDRDIRKTEKRYKDALQTVPWFPRFLPRLNTVIQIIRLYLARNAGGVPEGLVRGMFQKGHWQLPWEKRRDILESAQTINKGEKMVRIEAIFKILHDQSHESLEKLMEEAIQRHHLPLPPGLDHLGPESIADIFNRVLIFERDVIISRNIQTIREKRVEYAPAGLNGPLVLAVLGAAHLPGVVQHLRSPLTQLDEIISRFES